MKELTRTLLALPDNFFSSKKIIDTDFIILKLSSLLLDYNLQLAAQWEKVTCAQLTEDARLEVTIKLLKYNHHTSTKELTLLYNQAILLINYFESKKESCLANACTSLCSALYILLKNLTPTSAKKDSEIQFQDNVIDVALLLWAKEYKKLKECKESDKAVRI